MKARQFEVEEHKEYGGLGLKPKWIPMADPYGGMAAAHDILEHHPNDKGSTEEEFMALGAAMFIRGDGCMTNGYRQWQEDYYICGDIRDIWTWHDERHGRSAELRTPPRCRVPDIRERAAKVARACRKELIAEAKHDDHPHIPPRAWWTDMAGWLAHGYMKAKRRYRHFCPYTMASLFKQIERKCDKALEGASAGQIVTVRLNIRQHDARVERAFPSYPCEDYEPEVEIF